MQKVIKFLCPLACNSTACIITIVYRNHIKKVRPPPLNENLGGIFFSKLYGLISSALEDGYILKLKNNLEPE